MIKFIFVLLVLFFTITSCSIFNKKSSDENKPKSEEKKKDKEKQEERPGENSLKYNQPVIIDSSSYAIYPLILGENDEDRGISKSYGGQIVYWNIIFYNTENGEYHLLDSNRRMVIHSYVFGSDWNVSPSNSFENSSVTDSAGFSPQGKLIYYMVTTLDYNRDEKIDTDDPRYLFISDKDGKNFKQISPENYNVVNWQAVKATGKVLIQTVKDVNNDKKFNENDETIPFIYDIAAGGSPVEIFNNEFKSKTEMLLERQWNDK